MNLLSTSYLIVAVVCGTVAAQHLMVAVRLWERAVHTLLAAAYELDIVGKLPTGYSGTSRPACARCPGGP